ncbi:hypothetical protein VTN31DRAFT_3036 [Thermomyces dupontii]|uniref:uncharacterized protein n=1 Tax=Talaromyces thermophilus TaxID=28565 RepID=UPI0037435778
MRLGELSQLQNLTILGLAATGGLFLGYHVITFVRVLLSLFVLPGKSLRSFGPKGSWVVITGASDGLGKEFALQIAKFGYNLVLVSRTESKLQAIVDEIKAKNPSIQARILAMDFAQNNDADYEKLKNIISDIDVSVLINNVGRSHSIPVPFLLTPEDEMRDIIQINCLGTLKVTQVVAPALVKRKRGLILTMASFGGLVPTPLLATYSGSKAFLMQWSTALAAELAPHGVQVQLLQAHLITSAMSKIRRPTLMVPTAKAWVKSALAKIGRSGGLPTYHNMTAPYWSHGLLAWFLTCISGIYSPLVLGLNKSMHESIRRRALRKAEREKAKKAA